MNRRVIFKLLQIVAVIYKSPRMGMDLHHLINNCKRQQQHKAADGDIGTKIIFLSSFKLFIYLLYYAFYPHRYSSAASVDVAVTTTAVLLI
jgi:hypothetical protein